MNSIRRVIVAAGASAALAASCGVDTKVVGVLPDASAPPTFGEVDSGASTPEAGLALTSYCPSSQCPPGWTTCPGSRFPCDVNLLADPKNCGACGMACPKMTAFESFSCVEGRCAMECGASQGTLDCDGLVDTGCETSGRSQLHCGACGNACAQGTPCVWQDGPGSQVACGCPAGKIACTTCLDPTGDDSNCGACNNFCDRTGGGAPEYPNMYYGCRESTCGKPKCSGYFLDCDSKLENGCETSTVTDENCGACGNACPAGQHCYLNGRNQPECMCDGDLTLCSLGTQNGHPKALCTDVSSDVANCGSCGVNCVAVGLPGAKRTCDFGACVMRCQEGYSDCNGNEADGCEIETRSDPRNCGGCGIVCDAVAGQACVAGKCVVEPCDQIDAGEVTR